MVHFTKFSAVAAWNSAIRESINRSHLQQALLLFRQMKQNGLEPDRFTFPLIAKACAKLFDLKLSQTIHTDVVKSPFHSDVFVQTAIIDMYAKCNQLGDAYNLFERMTMKDTASCNVMLMGFVQSGFLDKVLCLVHDMRFSGIRPDTITVMGLIQGSLNTKNLDLVKSIHAFGIRLGIECDVSMANTWISAYSKCNDFASAKAVFERIDMGTRTVVSWNSMIAGYSNSDRFFDVLDVYKQMLSDGYRPDISTILSVLSSCNKPDKLFQGMLIHCHGIELGCDSDIYVTNDLISMYSKCSDTTSARFLFDRMFAKTCVSWNAMISGYAENGNINEAVELFHIMEAAGEKPDLVTVLSLISGCDHTGTLELGKLVHKYAISIGLRDNVVVCNALIDMYAKCGDLNNARELCYTLPVKTVVSWTSIISACALNGQSKEALDLFYVMLETGMKPNHLTFLAVLQACTHAGLLEKGMEFFKMMAQDCNMIPGVDHYSCMVNLLGRKRKLKEAVDLVKNMPMKPDAGIWGSLLSACRIHSNINIGKYVFSRLLELEPEVAVPYVEMANIYASERRWDEVATLRKVMKSNKVKKVPGQSFVHVNGKPHLFTVEDRVHPEALIIYATIGSLDLQSKDECAMLQEVGDMINREATSCSALNLNTNGATDFERGCIERALCLADVVGESLELDGKPKPCCAYRGTIPFQNILEITRRNKPNKAFIRQRKNWKPIEAWRRPRICC